MLKAKNRSTRVATVCAWAALFVGAHSARAETGFGLLAKPWLGETSYELSTASASVEPAGKESGEDSHFQLYEFQSDGRARFAIPGVADGIKVLHLGYEVNYLDFAAHGPLLPNHLFDGSIATGMPLGKFDDNILAVSAGVGYAGDNPFAQSNGVYGKGDLIFAHDFGADRYLVFGLDFDGNRSFAPDIPLPGVAYRAKQSDTLAYVVGFPFSSVEWRPFEPVTVSLEYTIPNNIEGQIGYRPVRQFVIFGGYHDSVQGFHIDDAPYTRRLFFQQQRAELGVQWIPVDNVELTLAGGYAFDQRFDTGFDVRNLNGVTRVSDEPYVRLNATVRY